MKDQNKENEAGEGEELSKRSCTVEEGAVDAFRATHHVNDRLHAYGISRDLIGYANRKPPPTFSAGVSFLSFTQTDKSTVWPNGAAVALNVVMEYTEGAEYNPLHGDDDDDDPARDVTNTEEAAEERRRAQQEYDYGARTGFWRYYRLLRDRKVPCTVFAAGMALERNPMIVRALQNASGVAGAAAGGGSSPTASSAASSSSSLATWEIASAGYRHVSHGCMDRDTERQHLLRTVHIHEQLFHKPPAGLRYCAAGGGTGSGDEGGGGGEGETSPHTAGLLQELGHFKYDSNHTGVTDDVPFWETDTLPQHSPRSHSQSSQQQKLHRPRLVIPYSCGTENDLRFDDAYACSTSYAEHLQETLRYMIDEAKVQGYTSTSSSESYPKVMTVVLHPRKARPGRVAGLATFLDYVMKCNSRNEVWICTREQIAKHWMDQHFPIGGGTSIGFSLQQEQDQQDQQKGDNDKNDDDSTAAVKGFAYGARSSSSSKEDAESSSRDNDDDKKNAATNDNGNEKTNNTAGDQKSATNDNNKEKKKKEEEQQVEEANKKEAAEEEEEAAVVQVSSFAEVAVACADSITTAQEASASALT